jgi:hypothetical protein
MNKTGLKPPQGTWLSKQGELFGPYNPEEIEKLKDNGIYLEFSWEWTPGSKNWSPINPPQAPPGIAPDENESDPTRFLTLPKINTKSRKGYQLETVLEVICHDQKDIVSGKIQWILDNGFVMISKDYSNSSPPFHQGRQVWLNLLNDSTGYTENIRAEIVKIAKTDRATWAYEFRWKHAPEILQGIQTS